MSKVITFSRVFPKYHPKAGQPTYFVEQIYNSLFSKNNLMDYPKGLEIDDTIMGVKKHTIRNGNRWKVGDKFSPRVWGTDINPKSGRSGAYHSKQIIIAPDIEIKKVWDFEIVNHSTYINGLLYSGAERRIALNDGLTEDDFLDWFQFPKPFKGQIICWNENINY